MGGGRKEGVEGVEGVKEKIRGEGVDAHVTYTRRSCEEI